MSYDAKHCYRMFREEELTFDEAQKKCRDEGLIPVQLKDEDAADVRNMLLDKYGIYNFILIYNTLYITNIRLSY